MGDRRAFVESRRKQGGKGVRKPQNRTEICRKTANRIGFFPEYRSRTAKPGTETRHSLEWGIMIACSCDSTLPSWLRVLPCLS